MREVEFPDGAGIPVLGLGTWRMGETPAGRPQEVAALRAAFEMGYRLIDTAEMYGEGGAEEVVGRALAEAVRAGDVRREDVLLTSKVYPHNASRLGTAAACDRSRTRLGVDQIDLYLLHWRGTHPLAETAEALQALVAAGRIRRWGVSNLDVRDMRELMTAASADSKDDRGCATNQVYYSLSERGPEFSLLPWMRERSMPLMAYCPIDQGRLAADRTLASIGELRGLTAAQVALAWILSQPGVVAIPKALATRHLRENRAAAEVSLSETEQQLIAARFPAPTKKMPLAMI